MYGINMNEKRVMFLILETKTYLYFPLSFFLFLCIIRMHEGLIRYQMHSQISYPLQSYLGAVFIPEMQAPCPPRPNSFAFVDDVNKE